MAEAKHTWRHAGDGAVLGPRGWLIAQVNLANPDAKPGLIAATPDLLAAAESGLPVLERELALLLDCHCVPDHDRTPRRETLDEDVRGEVEELEALIAQFKSAIAKAGTP